MIARRKYPELSYAVVVLLHNAAPASGLVLAPDTFVTELYGLAVKCDYDENAGSSDKYNDKFGVTFRLDSPNERWAIVFAI